MCNMNNSKIAFIMLMMSYLFGCAGISIPDRHVAISNIGKEEVREVSLYIDAERYLCPVILKPGISGTYLFANYPVGQAVLKWNYPDDEQNKKVFNLADYIDNQFSGN